MPHLARPLAIAFLALSFATAAAAATPLPFKPEEFNPRSEAEKLQLQQLAELMAGVEQAGVKTSIDDRKLAAFRRFFTEFPDGKFRPVAVGSLAKLLRQRDKVGDLLAEARELIGKSPSVPKSEVALSILKYYVGFKGDPNKALEVLDEQSRSPVADVAFSGELNVARLLAAAGKRKEAGERLDRRGDKDLTPAQLLERDFTLALILHEDSSQTPGDERIKQEERVLALLKRITAACVKDPQANTQYAAAFVGLARIALIRADARLAREAYDTVARLYPTSPAAQEAGMLGPQVDLLGKPVPAFEGPDLAGKPVSSKLLQGKIAVVDFWATTCPPCLVEAPKLAQLAAACKDRPFAIISVSLDLPERGEEIQQFLKKTSIEWPQIYEGKGWKSDIAALFRVTAMPSMFLVDETGIVKRVGLEGASLREAVEAELSRLEKSRRK